MSGYIVLNICDMLPSVARRTQKIMPQRVEEMFPACQESLSCTVALKAVPGVSDEVCVTPSVDPYGATSMKVEKGIDIDIKEEILGSIAVEAGKDKSCTDSLKAVPGSSVEVCLTVSNDANGAVCIKVEEGTNIDIKEEIPEPKSFPTI